LGAGGTAGVRRRLARAIAYFLGVSLVFATLGFLAIHFNWVFGTWLGNKWVVFGTVAVFAFLALTMLDLIDFEYSLAIKAPAVTSVFSALLYGMATGLIASPCMTPALLTLLGFVAQNNSAFLGFSLLFAFALGMTFPIILLSSFSNLLLFMPKPGSWMIEFRHLLGFGILFLCVSFLKPVTSSWQQHLALGLVWAFVFFYYFFSSKKESVARLIVAHQKRTSGIGIAEFISFGFFLKKALSIAALFFAIFYVGKSYLVYNRTKLKFVLMKLLR
jgi:thiol:disulfide interchange protein DsbD